MSVSFLCYSILLTLIISAAKLNILSNDNSEILGARPAFVFICQTDLQDLVMQLFGDKYFDLMKM